MEIPGPAKYNVTKTIGAESPKYSFRKLCGKTFWVNKYMDNPSAAEYNVPSNFNPKGKFFNSKIHDIKGAAFSKDHTNRWAKYKGKKYFLIIITVIKNIINRKLQKKFLKYQNIKKKIIT